MSPTAGPTAFQDVGGWATIVWLLVASASLTVGLIHLSIGFRQPRRAQVWFGLTGIANAAIACFELALMRSTTPDQAGHLLRWIHVPVFVYVTCLVLFLRTFFKAGRVWLAAAAIGCRGLASLVVNFLRSPNLNFVTITRLQPIPFLGGMVSVPEGVVSSWTRLGELGSALFLAFVADATIAVWRRGDRRRAAVIGGGAVLCIAVGVVSAGLVHRGIVHVPYLISLPYFVVLGAMSNELSRNVAKADKLERELSAQRGFLHESDQRLEVVAESADLSFWSWDSRSGRMWMTPKGRILHGYAEDERLDMNRFLSSVHPDERERLRRLIDAAAREGGSFEIEYRILPPDGGVRWISMRGAGERNESGSHVRGVSIDVTRRMTAEAEARLRQVELTHLSRVTMLGELSSSLAHELNQPLTAILSNAQAAHRMMDQGIDTREEIREILSEIISEDRRAGEVIRRMRGLLKKGEIRAEPLDLPEVVDEIARLLRSDLISRGVALSTDFETALPRVVADRVQTSQVLLNLVTNACDAMEQTPAEQRRLLLSAGRADRDLVRVSVADSGSGIAQADVESLFQPFVTTKTTGMGLGLAVCRTIVAAHGGRIWATHNPERGTTFHFTLPAAVETRA